MNRSYCLISENGQSAGNIKYIHTIYRGSSETARYTPFLLISYFFFDVISMKLLEKKIRK